MKKTKSKKKAKQVSLAQKNPKVIALTMIILYFLMNYLMTDLAETVSVPLIAVCVLVAPFMLYCYYVNDYCREQYPVGGTDVPEFVKNEKRYVLIGWLAILISGIIILIAEPFVVPKCFPVLDTTYYQSQIILMAFIAPVMEELIFRYLLYDRWLRRKWGWFWGFMAVAFLFVMCHPVTNVHSFVIYWVPTVLFFLIYHEFGLYGSIVIHMIYNMMAM